MPKNRATLSRDEDAGREEASPSSPAPREPPSTPENARDPTARDHLPAPPTRDFLPPTPIPPMLPYWWYQFGIITTAYP